MSRSPLKEHHLHWLINSIALAALGYLAFSIWGEVRTAFVAVSAMGVLIALGLLLVNHGLRFLRWQTYLSALGHTMPLLFSGQIYVASFALITTPGRAEEMLRGVFLKEFT